MAAVVPVTAPQPDLLAMDVSGLLSGKVTYAEFLPLLSGWLLTTGLTVLLVAALTLFGLKAYQLFVTRIFALINQNLKPDARLRVTQRSNTLSGILSSAGKVVILFLGLTIILSKIGVNVAPILASAGIVGLAVGFGAQSLVKDVINGFFILTEDQYGIGDVIEVSGNTGLVENMNLRITQLRNQHGQLITIPNGVIQVVVNHSKEWARAVLEISIAYNEDPDKAMKLLREIGEEIQAEMPDQVIEPVEIQGVESFKETEVVIKLSIKTQPSSQWAVARAFRRKVWYRFREHGIATPAPQKSLWLGTAGDNRGDAGAVPVADEVASPATAGDK